MKIAFDHQIFSSQKYGGISRYHVQLGEALNELGVDVKAFAPVHRNEYLNNHPSLERGQFIKWVPPKTTRLIKYYNNIYGRFKIRNWSPDILHETYYSRRTVGNIDTPTVITVHDMIHELYPEFFTDSATTSEIKLKAIQRAEHVICISKNTKTDLIKFFDIAEEKISVVYHGCNMISNHADNQGIDDMEPYLLYVGGRNNYKNFKNLLRAFGNSNSLKRDFNVIAFGGGDFLPEEKELLKEFDIFDKVFQLSGDDQLLGRLYANAIAFVFPSLYEGFGMPVLEAMAHDCPITASNTSSIPEVAGKAAELFDPTDLDSIRSSIEKVVYSEEFKKELISKGNKQLKKFSWEKCAKETENVYKKILSHQL